MQRLLGKALAAILVLGLVAAATAGAASLITGKDIVNGTVTGADLKQGSVKLGDLSAKAKSSLAQPGPAGPAGPTGPQGPAGPQGEAGSADRYAEVGADATLGAHVKNITQDQVTKGDIGLTPGVDPGIYCFAFPADAMPVAGSANGLSGDVFATLQIKDDGVFGCPDGANVRVTTFDLSEGGTEDRAFRLLLENG